MASCAAPRAMPQVCCEPHGAPERRSTARPDGLARERMHGRLSGQKCRAGIVQFACMQAAHPLLEAPLPAQGPAVPREQLLLGVGVRCSARERTWPMR